MYTYRKAEPKTGNCKFPDWLHSQKSQSLDGQTAPRIGPGKVSVEIISKKGARLKPPVHSRSVSAFLSAGAKIGCEGVKEVAAPREKRDSGVAVIGNAGNWKSCALWVCYVGVLSKL